MARTVRRPAPAHGWGRYAAPVAFLLAATVAVVLVRSALHTGVAPAPTPATTAHVARTTAPTTTSKPTATTTPASRFYVVQAGDTFSTIAAKSGTTVATIERLNPGVASTSLHIGQKIRVG